MANRIASAAHAAQLVRLVGTEATFQVAGAKKGTVHNVWVHLGEESAACGCRAFLAEGRCGHCDAAVDSAKAQGLMLTNAARATWERMSRTRWRAPPLEPSPRVGWRWGGRRVTAAFPNLRQRAAALLFPGACGSCPGRSALCSRERSHADRCCPQRSGCQDHRSAYARHA